MNRYGKTGLRVLGGLLALVLAAGGLLPDGAAYAAGTGAYRVAEDAAYIVEEDAHAAEQDSRPLRAQALRAAVVPDNVTMHLFNYTGAVNRYDGRVLTFCNSANQNAKDGVLQRSDDRPVMQATLENGWPQVLGVMGPTAEDRSGSLQYLFDPDTAVAGKESYAVGRGGSTGLFQRDDKGYYCYDSLQNAAWYDPDTQMFRLGNFLLRPHYTGYVQPNGKTAEQDYTQAFNGNFFPFNTVDGAEEDPAGNALPTYRLADGAVDLWFGMSMEFDFYMPAGGRIGGEDMVFQFLGDDDVFVYIDDVLVLDIGGTHGANSGSINFATGAVRHPRADVIGPAGGSYTDTTLKAKFDAAGIGGTFQGDTFGDYTKHTLKFFYLERGGCVSYCYLRFNTPTLPEHSLTVAKELSGGGQSLNRYLTDALDYRFRVVRPGGRLYVPEGTAYQVLEGAAVTGTGAVGPEGYFSLKAGQMAQFTDMMGLGGGHYDYLVEETMPTELTGQYGEVQYTVGSGTGTAATPSASTEFTGFRTAPLSAAETQLVTYRNVVDTGALGELRITKRVADGSAAEAGQVFDMAVTLGGQPVPAGTPYTVDGAARTVETAGIVPLAHGETAVFGGLLAGTAYAVAEQAPAGFRVRYEASVTAEGRTVPAGTEGQVPVGGRVAVTVTNATYDYAVTLPLSKVLLGAAADRTETFRFLLEETDADGTVLRQLPETAITVRGGEVTAGHLTIGFVSGDRTAHSYRLREAESSGVWCGGEVYRLVIVPNGVDGASAVTVNGQAWDDAALAFVNRTLETLTVTKTVVGELGDRDRAFSFTAAMTLDGEPVPFPAGDGWTLSGGRAVFSLRHGETLVLRGLPYGAVVTVTETGHEGYTVTNSSRSGDSGAAELTGGDRIDFVNSKRAVPDMGVAGGTWLPAGLLTACGGGLALAARRRRRLL